MYYTMYGQLVEVINCHHLFPSWMRSSVGQSVSLLRRRSKVQILSHIQELSLQKSGDTMREQHP